ncbi:MAG: mannonate dehydratase [Prolixibacteraceae bacterium]|jgi:mannonate dehydratase|nr:mannonate dehydratase [Prolixibacteraceae bacterium]
MSKSGAETLARNIIVVTQGFINGTVGNVADYRKVFLELIQNYSEIDRDKLRQNLSSFLNDVIPVAEEAGINLCIHPDDPPYPVLGLPRIAGTIDDFRWIMEQNRSLRNGITFCSGSLSARVDNDLTEFVRQLGDRIHFIHLRNTQMLEDVSFYESEGF